MEYWTNVVRELAWDGTKRLSHSGDGFHKTKELAMEEIADDCLDGEYVHTLHVFDMFREHMACALYDLEDKAHIWWKQKKIEEMEEEEEENRRYNDYRSMER